MWSSQQLSRGQTSAEVSAVPYTRYRLLRDSGVYTQGQEAPVADALTRPEVQAALDALPDGDWS